MSAPVDVAFEHASTTVPDLGQAERFFVDVLGATVRSRAVFAGAPADRPDAEPFDMVRTFHAHPAATASLVSLSLGGVVVELFGYDAPDQAVTMPRNCDVGGQHLGFRVADIAASVEVLRGVPGVTVLGEPNTAVKVDGVLRTWIYFLTPWGLQLELAEERPA